MFRFFCLLHALCDLRSKHPLLEFRDLSASGRATAFRLNGLGSNPSLKNVFLAGKVWIPRAWFFSNDFAIEQCHTRHNILSFHLSLKN